MISVLLNIFKIVFLLGFLIFIHEGGHFLFAKLFKVKVKEFSIGFGPVIWEKQGKETRYQLRLIPLGGFVNMLGEAERSDEEGAFNKASIPKRIIILLAGGLVNILFGLLVFCIIMSYLRISVGANDGSVMTNIYYSLLDTKDFVIAVFDSVKLIFTGNVQMDQLMGPVGISEVVIETKGLVDFAYILCSVSLSLGVTNLLPFPPLDGGKILILLIEAIRRKPLKENIEVGIQLAGFFLLMGLSLYVAYNDVIRIF